MSRHRHDRFNAFRFAFGLALIFVGVVFLLDQTGLLDSDFLFDFWPMFLVLAGAGKLVYPGSSSRFGGLVLLLIGVWLQLDVLHLIDYRFWAFWPALLVLVGLRVTWVGLFGRRRRAADDASVVNAVAVLSGTKRVNRSQSFRGGDLVAFLGGCDVDLRGAEIADGPAELEVFACLGGIEIRVPEHWTVTVGGTPLLGGFDDATRTGGGGPQLLVKGLAILGSVEIKN